MVRALVVLAIVAIVVLVITGVIYVTRTDDTVNITIDKRKLRHTTDRAAEEGREALRKAGKAIERGGEKLQETPEPSRAPAPAAP